MAEFFRQHDISGVRLNLRDFEESVLPDSPPHSAAPGEASLEVDSVRVYSDRLAESVQAAADLLRPLFEETKGSDSFVAVPLPADLSHDVESMVEEAMLFWSRLGRENAILMVPGTEEGISALQKLIAGGVNVGVRHLLTVRRYREVFDSFLLGLEKRLRQNEDVRHVNSIAEFDLGQLAILSGDIPDTATSKLPGQQNTLAVSIARLAYASYRDFVFSERFQALAKHGLRAQRLAWNMAGAEPGFAEAISDQVIGPATVCQLPVEAIRKLHDRSLSGPGISHRLPEAERIALRYQQRYPDLDQRCADEVERAIKEQVINTDHALATIEERTGAPW